MYIENYKYFTLDFFDTMLKKGWQETDFSDYFKIPLENLQKEMKKKFGALPTNAIYTNFFNKEVSSVETTTEKTTTEEVTSYSDNELKNRLNTVDNFISTYTQLLEEKIPKQAEEILKELKSIEQRIKQLINSRIETIEYLDSCYKERESLLKEIEIMNSKFHFIYVSHDGTIETDEKETEEVFDFSGWDELLPSLISSEYLEHLTIKKVKTISMLICNEVKRKDNHEEYQIIFEDEDLKKVYYDLINM